MFLNRYSNPVKVREGRSSHIVSAVDAVTRQECVLKIPKTQEAAEAVAREKRILRKLQHKNVIRVYNIDEYGEYVVLDRKERDLHDYISRYGPVAEEIGKTIILQVLKGVAYLHSKNIAHRDLKPENILLDESIESVVVCDLGLSLEFNDTTVDRDAVGTTFYQAHEILRMHVERGSTAERTGYEITAVDMWSVGVVLYCLLSGERPWGGTEDVRVMLMHSFDGPSFSSPCWRKVSATAKGFIRRLLARDPSHRMTAVQALHHPWIGGMPATTIQRAWRSK